MLERRMLMSASRAGFCASAAGILFLGLLLWRARWKSRPDLGRVFFVRLAVFVVVGVIAGSALLSKFAVSVDDLSAWESGRRRFCAIGMSPWLEVGPGQFRRCLRAFAAVQQPAAQRHRTLDAAGDCRGVLGVFAAIPAMVVVVLPCRSVRACPATALAHGLLEAAALLCFRPDPAFADRL